ncbi:hypothetical protein M153_672000904 [Pseudoloma neurophilia]|uniref:Uncharacterized protein n=1 Tax=Pseudoloma neurophilia TaxID=146866 RepID=A0A0R0LWR7_9MICR|nr:hypothetical protein M153_672000904 [Pseudoloma neurophilia]
MLVWAVLCIYRDTFKTTSKDCPFRLPIFGVRVFFFFYPCF